LLQLCNSMKEWIQAARLRTLPLAISGILLGSAVAYLQGRFQITVLFFGTITAVFLQVLSNFANDYGDFKKGTDTQANRQDRALASGRISEKDMLYGIWIMIALSLASGFSLLFFSFHVFNSKFLLFFGIGLASIVAAYKYTAGKNAYGYFGLGDLFVLVFFGVVSIGGIYFLHAGNISKEAWLAALGCGLLSTAVLNVNNIRDIESDKKSNKITIPVRIGYLNALRYHTALVWVGFSSVLGSFLQHLKQAESNPSGLEYLMICTAFSPFIFLFGSHVNQLKEIRLGDRMAYNKELKKLSLSILTLSCFYWLLAYLFTR
jgi:1,4-dihydroxy-2-naphthoate polyprenyltransferase